MLTVAISSSSLAPWVPCRKKDFKRVLNLAELKAEENFFDLGCGTGGLNIYIANNSSATSTGIELALPFFLISWIRSFLYGNDKLKFKYGNLYKYNLKNADVVFIFAAGRKQIGNKLKDELKSGSRVISYTFPIEEWEALEIYKPTQNDISIYLYKV